MVRIDIRFVPKEHVHVIDELAQSKNMSRQAYLRYIIGQVVREELLLKQSKKFENLVVNATEIVALNNQILEQFTEG